MRRLTLGLASALVGMTLAASLLPGPTAVTPVAAQSQTLAQLVASATPGQTVTVPTGAHPALAITNRIWAPPLKILGQDGATVDSVTLSGVTGLVVEKVKIPRTVLINNGSSDITFKQNVITGQGGIAIDVRSRSHHLSFIGNTVERGGRNILLYSGSVPESQWIHHVTIQGNDLGGAVGDNIQITGATDVLIAQNYIHDPADNTDHNDGIQLLGAQRVRITQNTLTTHGGCCLGDQGIIISAARAAGGTTSTVPDPYLKVSNTTVDHNLIHHWRGTGIAVDGTLNTTITRNTSWDNFSSASTTSKIGLLIGTTLGPNTGIVVDGNILQTVVKGNSAAVFPNLVNNCIGGDPLFVDRVLYELKPASLCLGFGYVDTAVEPPPPTTTSTTTTTLMSPTTTTTTTTTIPLPPVPTTTLAPPPPACHPSYTPCLPFVVDIDCAGRGNGPVYIAFKVKIVGPDVYRLDGDKSGFGCEKLGA